MQPGAPTILVLFGSLLAIALMSGYGLWGLDSSPWAWVVATTVVGCLLFGAAS